ncbi:acyl carrier protein [Actinokineospora diospyrosa]|uniref:Phosphopantetheine attachment site n=1 Tax=Actinokineospora diospyrosa TaxID=103728 RepID=A0ABT1IFF8_9PSEU|nr:acyl carrier protein [Actinokineospora diospyrosa]MCP2271391.1 Phosphopantetheine attachment site [Actinokineospora diospyrosa]
MSEVLGAVTRFVVEEFLPDVRADELDPDLDLVAAGVLDSLGVLRVLAWLQDTFDVPADDVDPADLRSVRAVAGLAAAPVRAG